MLITEVGDIVKFIEVPRPNLRGKSIISKGDQTTLIGEDNQYFIVTPTNLEEHLTSVYKKRAEACLNIRFDYHVENANCETFCHRIHGDWTSASNIQRAQGSTKQTVLYWNKLSNRGLFKDDPLDKQIKSKILEQEGLKLHLENI